MTRSTGSIPLRFESVELAGLARSTLEPLGREAEAMDATLMVEASGPETRVSADPEKIAWVVATLVGNALRYLPRGTRLHPGGHITVRVVDEAPPGHVTLAVQDDGPGIPEDKRAALFKRRAGEQHAIGLALTLVSDVVAAHGGRLEVESSTASYEHGTTVRVILPKASEPPPGGTPTSGRAGRRASSRPPSR